MDKNTENHQVGYFSCIFSYHVGLAQGETWTRQNWTHHRGWNVGKQAVGVLCICVCLFYPVGLFVLQFLY